MTRISWTGLLSVGLLCSTFAAASADAGPKAFATPDLAVDAMIKACAKNSTSQLLALFGPDGKDVVESGDRSDDKDNRKKFVRVATEKKMLVPDPKNTDKETLVIGAQEWPFPIPLVRKDGQWSFDASQGREEILARRIGANELSAIEVCHGYVDAQDEYAQDHVVKGLPLYASRIVSTEGKQDGLYWPSTPGAKECEVPIGFSKAAKELATKSWDPYHGYYFKILTAQGSNAKGGAFSYLVKDQMMGGYALVAWPAEYNVSGVKTFIVNHDGIVFEKDLGSDTAKTIEGMKEFNPDATWTATASTTTATMVNNAVSAAVSSGTKTTP